MKVHMYGGMEVQRCMNNCRCQKVTHPKIVLMLHKNTKVQPHRLMHTALKQESK